VKCPNCGAVNVLEGTPTVTQSYSNVPKEPVPHYTIDEASRMAKGLIEESSSYWVQVTIPHVDDIEYCCKRVYGSDKDRNNEVWVTKAKAFVNAPKNIVHNNYWNHETEWDGSTLGHLKIIEDYGNNRLMLKEHKTFCTTVLRNDLVVRAIYEEYPDQFWCYSASEEVPSVPEKGGWRRGHLVLAGCLITEVEPNRCEVSLINCFDFGGFIQIKYIEEEQKRVGIRISRLKKRAEEDYRTQLSRAQQQSYQSQSHHQPVRSQESSQGLVYDTSAVCSICPSCNTQSSAKFCVNDGTRLEIACIRCSTPVNGTKFCPGCGSKLVV